MNKHTDTPWEDNKMGLITDTEGHKIASMYMHMIYRDSDALMKANAAYIVKAVNSHDALVEALRRISKVKPDRIDHVLDCVVLERAANIASEALKLAGEEA
jgi:hypothetical protein